MANSPRFEIPELVNNAGNVARVNYLLRLVDALLAGGRALSDSTLAEPGSPSEGDLYLLPATGSLTGTDWSTFTNGNLAFYTNAAWSEITVDAGLEGVQLHIADTDRDLVYRGSTLGWQESGYSVAETVAASGNAQGAGYDVVRRVTEVTSATAATNDSLDLPAAVAGDHRVIRNASGVSIDVYPASGESINALAANASLAVADGTTVQLFAVAGQWYSA